ncbi:MAG TPA: acylneuraminate cytidylyltransferase family protein [Tepidisphaeraceae bacterium]|jgi:CMP-N-acetylneuraminic acid synthetase|nr:acylneuraminate cytidylyltransferase family protein [Tepidisphaeraceae bacterium]
MNTLGVILARAGSVGLPSKHLLPLLGRPVISYTFAHAQAALWLTHVVLSTDCAQLRGMAQAVGIDTVVRPAHLATSDASVQDAMLHAMDEIESTSDFHADALVVLYGNVPVRTEGVIDRAIEMLERTGCDSVRTFCPVGKWHPAWMSKLSDDGIVEALHPGSIHRRQDLQPLLLHDGGAVVVSRESMLRGRAMPNDPHAFFGVDRRGVRTEQGDVIEVDHQRDLYWAEAVLRDQQAMRKAS